MRKQQYWRSFGASIELLICDTKSLREVRTEGAPSAIDDTRPTHDLDSLLDKLAKPLRDAGIDVSTEGISGDPLHEMIISSSTAAWVLEALPCDVLLVRLMDAARP